MIVKVKPKIRSIPTATIYLIPIVILIPFVLTYGVRVPIWDELPVAVIFEKIAAGNAGLSDFAEIYNDHRYFFLRAIVVPLAFLTGWNKIYEMAIGLLFAAITGIFLVRMSRQCYPDIYPSKKFHIVNGLCGLILFSLVQYQNWLWGLQLGVFLVNLCVTVALFILYSGRKFGGYRRIIFAALPTVIASFTLAQGLISWLAILPSVVLSSKTLKSGLKDGAIWLGLFGISTAVYVMGYDAENSTRFDVFYLLNHPLYWLRFFFTLLGAPLAQYSAPIATLLGVIVFCRLIGAIAWGWRKRGMECLRTVAPWLSLALFALLFATITTFGRVEAAFVDLGLDFALGSRYTSNSLFLWIATLQIGLYFFTGERPDIRRKWGLNYLAILIIFLTGINSAYAVKKAQFYRESSESVRTCLKVIQVLDERSPQCWNWWSIMPDRDRLRRRTAVLNNLGLIDSPDLKFTNRPEDYGSLVWDNSQNVFSRLRPDDWILVKGDIRLEPSVLAGDRSPLLLISKIDQKSAIAFFEIGSKSVYSRGKITSIFAIPTSVFNLYQETSVRAWIRDPESEELLPLAGTTQIKIVPDGIPDPRFNRQPQTVYGFVSVPDTPRVLNPGDRFTLDGWAAFGDRDEQPDRVYFSYGDEDFFFAETAIDLDTPQVVEHFDSDRYSNSGWMAELSARDLPPGETAIRAWVYDPEAGEFVTLEREVPVIVIEKDGDRG